MRPARASRHRQGDPAATAILPVAATSRATNQHRPKAAKIAAMVTAAPMPDVPASPRPGGKERRGQHDADEAALALAIALPKNGGMDHTLATGGHRARQFNVSGLDRTQLNALVLVVNSSALQIVLIGSETRIQRLRNG